MTFIPEARIEARAAALWQQYGLSPAFDVERLADDLGLGVVWEEVPDDGGGRILGQLIPEKRLIVLNERHLTALEEKDGRLRRYTIGHEIGHWELHADAVRSGTLSLLRDGRTWCRDGSTDQVERQAEMFSAALLIPAELLRVALPTAPWRGWPPVYELATRFLVNPTPMVIRLERLGLMYLDADETPRSGPKPPPGQGRLFDP